MIYSLSFFLLIKNIIKNIINAIGSNHNKFNQLNSSSGNKAWKEKLLYYQSVAETDPDKIAGIEHRAQESGITFIKVNGVEKKVEDTEYITENDEGEYEINIAKMSALLKAICRFCAVPIKVPVASQK